MIEKRFKEFVEANFDEEDQYTLIWANDIAAIMEDFFPKLPIKELSRQIKISNRVKQIVNRRYMNDLLREFNESKVHVVWFKGELLQNALYMDHIIRPVGDIDVYIKPEQFEQGMSLLKSNGFVFFDSEADKNVHHIRFIKGHVKLELHKKFLNPFTSIDEKFFHDHLKEISFQDNFCLGFDHSATFLHLLYHVYMDTLLFKRTFKPILKDNVYMAERFMFRIYEIAKYAHVYEKDIDWEAICSDILSQRLKMCFKNIMIMVDEIFYEVLPIRLMTAVKSKKYLLEEF